MPTAKKELRSNRAGRKKAQPPRAPRPANLPRPVSDDELGQVPGIPAEEAVLAALGPLADDDRATFQKIRLGLARHLGSDAAARLWLLTPAGDGQPTAAEQIRAGRGRAILAALQAQWGRNPVYA